MLDFMQAVAADQQPDTVFAELEKLVDETIGIKLFTLMEVNNRLGVACRSYTNQPAAYPVSGEKPLQDNAWSKQVLGRHETFVANSIDEIAAVFPDYELIQSLGCESCLNLPIVVAGKAIGTLNCLHEAGHYAPERVLAAQTLKQPGALAFLLKMCIDRNIEHA